MDPIYGLSISPDDEDNIISALEHARRVNPIEILATSSLLRNAAKLFPVLTHLDLGCDLRASHVRGVPVIPGGFLGGPPHFYDISAQETYPFQNCPRIFRQLGISSLSNSRKYPRMLIFHRRESGPADPDRNSFHFFP